jgi:acetyl esterase
VSHYGRRDRYAPAVSITAIPPAVARDVMKESRMPVPSRIATIAAGVFGGTALLAGGVAGALTLNPWLGSQLIRLVFRQNDVKVSAALQKHTPDGVASFLDVPYRAGDADAELDVFVPEDAVAAGRALPGVVWVHGGAWVSGQRKDWRPYFMRLAEQGFAVAAVGYSLAPVQTYPTQVRQLDAALAYLRTHADRFHLDPDRIVLAGDSSGAQITSQYGALVTNEVYARDAQISPTLPADSLRGGLFYCGIFDFDRYFGAPGIIGYGTKVATWAYTGRRGTTMEANPALREMSTIRHLSGAFPPTFVSGGNADPLTELQSKPFADALERQGVPVSRLFFADDHEPGLGHEYQFDLDAPEGQRALRESVAFLRTVTA